jgi:hypothetical protein
MQPGHTATIPQRASAHGNQPHAPHFQHYPWHARTTNVSTGLGNATQLDAARAVTFVCTLWFGLLNTSRTG